MIADSFSSVATTIGGGFFGGLLILQDILFSDFKMTFWTRRINKLMLLEN
jgi:hypothetical protein